MRQKTTGILPIFHDKNIFYHFNSHKLPLDDQGLYRPLEMVLLPDQGFELGQTYKEGISEIKLDHQKKYYTFTKMLDLPTQILKKPVNPSQIIERLITFKGCPYIWGGNWIASEEELLFIEKRCSEYSENFIKNIKHLLSGVDCSGLLYAATLATVPRNTGDLVNFGRFIPIDGADNTRICDQVRPLDLLVWKGHVLIFLDQKTLIESRKDFGCIVVDARTRLDEIRQTRIPSSVLGDNRFYIKRWVEAS